jgi:MFS family permease
MILAQALLALAFNSPGVFAPVTAPALGYRPESVGAYMALLSVGSLLGGMLIDGVIRRYGGTRTLQISALVTALGLLLAATGIRWLVVCSAGVIGWAGGMMVPCVIHLLARATPPERAGIVFAINQCGVPIGFGLAGVVIPALLLAMSWQAAAALIALAVMLILALLQPMRAALDADRAPGARLGGRALIEPLRVAWRDPRLRLLGWLAFALMAIQISILAYLVSYANLELGYSHVQAGAALLASQLAAIAMRLVLGWVLDRVGRHFALLGVLGCAAGCASLGLGLLQPGWPYWVLIAASAVSGALTMSWVSVYFAAVARTAPEGRSATAVGGTQVFNSAGSMLGPLLFSALVAASGRYSLAFMLMSVFGLAIGVRLLAAERRFAAPAAARG